VVLRHNIITPRKGAGSRPVEAEPAFVRGELPQIASLAGAGRLTEGHEAIGDLLFDFQPVIATRAELLSRTLDVLRRCRATALRRCLLVAIYRDARVAPGPVVRVHGPATRHSPPVQINPAGTQLPTSTRIADTAK
jgi:hypothetical protein